ncbi:MAG: RluA family pseudouridine synthase, partial [Eubacteriales bacterium]
PAAGIMVFARTSKSAARLFEEMRQGKFEKIYYTVVSGVPVKLKGRVVNYLLKDTINNKVEVVSQASEGAKEAILEYEVLSTTANNELSLIKVRLITGRAHQIRVQLSAMGHPIFGDRKYGGKCPNGSFMALHAVKLSFPHPIKKELMTFKCYPPSCEPWDKFDFRLE